MRAKRKSRGVSEQERSVSKELSFVPDGDVARDTMFYVLDRSRVVRFLCGQLSGRSLAFRAQAHLDETDSKQLQKAKSYGGTAWGEG